jgi:hypothetical protein
MGPRVQAKKYLTHALGRLSKDYYAGEALVRSKADPPAKGRVHSFYKDCRIAGIGLNGKTSALFGVYVIRVFHLPDGKDLGEPLTGPRHERPGTVGAPILDQSVYHRCGFRGKAKRIPG